jgi:hypothetical protein
MRLPDPSRSRVVLIGTSIYDDPSLGSLLQVRNNIDELRVVLTHPEFGGLAPTNVRVMQDPRKPVPVCRAMYEAAAQAEDLLLIYYAGHGLLDLDDPDLHLALQGSQRQYKRYTALSVREIKRVFQTTRATNRVLILDCCFSGRALEQVMGDLDVPLGDIDIDGVYVLASTSPNQPAVAPLEDRYTAFTGALLKILQTGAPDGPPLLPLRLIGDTLIRTLARTDLPSPQQKIVNTVADLALVRNRAAGAPIATPQPRLTGKLDRAGRAPSEPTAEIFSGYGRFLVARRVALAAIAVGAGTLIKVLAPGWFSTSDAASNAPVAQVSFVHGLAAWLVAVVALALAWLAHQALPRRYVLTIDRDHVQLQVGRHDFSYPWAEVAQIRLGQEPMKHRGPLVLLLRLQPGAPLPRRHRWFPPRLVAGHDTHDTLVFADPRRLVATPDQIEHALEQFAGTAWAPALEVIGASAAPHGAVRTGGARFATRRPHLALLAVAWLAIGMSPLTDLSGLPPWRVMQTITWSLLFCAPTIAVVWCVLHPATLHINTQGLSLTRSGRTLSYAWQDLESVAVLPSPQMGIWPPVLFARLRDEADIPSGARLPPRYSTRLRGMVVCDLFTLTTKRQAIDKALTRYAQGLWTATFHPEYGLEDDGDARIAFHGSVVGLRTLLLGVCAFAVLQLLTPPTVQVGAPVTVRLSQVLPNVVVAVLTAIYVRTPCTLTLDPHQIRLTLWGRSVAIPWQDIRHIMVWQTHTTNPHPKGEPTVTSTHAIVVYLRDGAKPPALWWLPWKSREKSGGLVLATIDGPFLRLGVSAETVDRSLAQFAGPRYLQLTSRKGR